MSEHAYTFLRQTWQIASVIDAEEIESLAHRLSELRGTIWCIGLGGSSANCSHAAADLRRLCGIDARALGESVPELTARANDDGWRSVFSGHLSDWGKPSDALLVLSVGGGAEGVSQPLIEAISVAKQIGMKVYGIVGRDGGHTKTHGDCVVVVPTVDDALVTPHTEAWHMVVLHLLVSHPKLQKRATKW